jgi:thiol-disulfide isomerase/thioredoxin
MEDGTEWAAIYFKKGSNLTMTLDAKAFDETLKFEGQGAAENNFLAWINLSDEKFNEEQVKFQPNNDFAGYEKLRDAYKTIIADRMKDTNFEADFITYINERQNNMINFLDQLYEPIKSATNTTGKKSSSFDYENHNGGKSKLTDFSGKYLYLDVWATWCGPCIQEIPFLKQLEAQYQGKNIVFISISVDALKDHDKWKKFVAERNLGGVQLLADNATESAFIKAYGVLTIPRFILIDPNGIIVDANAKRPSNVDLKQQLDLLLQ